MTVVLLRQRPGSYRDDAVKFARDRFNPPNVYRVPGISFARVPAGSRLSSNSSWFIEVSYSGQNYQHSHEETGCTVCCEMLAALARESTANQLVHIAVQHSRKEKFNEGLLLF